MYKKISLYILVLLIFSLGHPDWILSISTYQNNTVPNALANLCASENCLPLQNWLNAKTSILEKECKEAKTCKERMILVDKLFYIQKQLDLFGIADVEVMDSLCDGYLNILNTYVEISPSAPKLKIGETLLLQSQIKVGESTCDGEIQWASADNNVATIDQNGNVTAVGNGTALIVAIVRGVQDIMGTINIMVGPDPNKVDIVLVVQSDHATYEWMGFDYWNCPGNLCLNDEFYNSNWEVFSWWGMGGNPGDIWPGKVAVDHPGVLGISLYPEGPFSDGPININYTVGNYSSAKSQKIYIKGLGVGSANILACIGGGDPGCDPYDKYQYGHMESGPWEVAASTVLYKEYVGLRDIGPQILFSIEEKFLDYQLGVIGFGQDPSISYCNQDDMWPEWKPYAEPKPYYDWVPLTNNYSTILQGISNLSLICVVPIDGSIQGNTAYTAILHAIHDTPWRAGVEKVIILFQASSVDWFNPENEVELVSGNTLDMVITEALSENISLFTLRGGSQVGAQLQKMAQSTSGKYYGDDTIWPLLNGLEQAFEGIYIKIREP